jgi:hypothetical protein
MLISERLASIGTLAAGVDQRAEPWLTFFPETMK